MPNRYNSTIKDKMDYCIDCNDGVLKPVIAGRCKRWHYKFHKAKEILRRKVAKQQFKKGFPVTKHVFAPSEPGMSLKEWFKQRGAEMTGICANCGGSTSKGHWHYEKYSVAHIFPKFKFPSVKLHPLNFIELCYFSPSCHGNMDNKGMGYTVRMKCWPSMVANFRQFEPFLTDKEKSTEFYKSFKFEADKTPPPPL